MHLTRSLLRTFPIVLVVIVSGALASVASAAVQARPSDALVESIGVNTHLNYDGTPYSEFAKVRQSLDELGIRYIRDAVGLTRPDIDARFRQLASDGIRMDVIAGDPQHRWGTGTVEQQLNVIEKELPGAVASIEGPNEYDLSGFPNWASELRTFTRQLAEGVRSRPALASIPIIAPSIVESQNEASIGDLTPWINYGNTHTYMGGEIPEMPRWNTELAAVAKFAGSLPVQVTETGFNNALKTTNPHRPTSEAASAIYTPRLFLEDFNRGIARTYIYELLDEGNDPGETNIEAHFGLLRNNFTKKPDAIALQNLISILSDKGSSFTPGSLSYSIEGGPSTMQQVLLQKRDGSFYLALWNRVSVWDPQRRVDLQPANVPITLQLGQAASRIEVFEPNTAQTPVSTIAGPTSSLRLSLSPKVQIVRVTPNGSASTGSTPEAPPTSTPEAPPTSAPEAPPTSTPEAPPTSAPEAPSAPVSGPPAETSAPGESRSATPPSATPPSAAPEASAEQAAEAPGEPPTLPPSEPPLPPVSTPPSSLPSTSTSSAAAPHHPRHQAKPPKRHSRGRSSHGTSASSCTRSRLTKRCLRIAARRGV